MGSPITFSGFNNIDFGVVLNSLMAQATAPLTALQTKQAALKSQSNTVDTLGTRLSSLQSAADALGDISSLQSFQATSSNSASVSATIGSGAVAGHYDVVVNELAKAQVTASTEAPDASTTAVADSGTITIGGVPVNISGPVTLQQLAAAINDTDGIGVTASVVRSSANGYRLVLTGQTTGADGAFTIVNQLGGSGVTFTDTNSDGTSGDSPEDNAVSATDANVLVNNVSIVSSSNTLTDVIPGVTLQVSKKDPTDAVGIDVTTDDGALGTQVAGFVKAYNDLVKFATDQTTAAAGGDASSIGRDPLLRQLRNQLRSMVGGAYSGGVFSRLSEVGVEFTQTGTLQLNQSIFAAAVADHPSDVAQLFAGAGGAFPALSSTIGEYSQAGGFLSSFQTNLTQQSAGLDRQIAAMQDRLAVQRASLQAEFSAADAAISQLQSQSSALTNFSASLTSSQSGG